MTRAEIENELRSYPQHKARLALLQVRAVEIEHEIIEARGKLDDPSGVGAQVLDGMPHAHSNASVVERQAERIEKVDDKIYALQWELNDVQAEAFRVGCQVKRVEAWLSGLTERERMVVEGFYIDGLFLSMVRRRYEDEYRTTLSQRYVKKIKSCALEKMEAVSG